MDLEELAHRRALGDAMITFVGEIMEHVTIRDDVMRQVVTEKYRRSVEEAARHGIEVSLCWHSLAVWTEIGKERIGYFARALDCLNAESGIEPPLSAHQNWATNHMQADCLYEIARVHAVEGSPEVARRFLEEALPLARHAETMRIPAGITHDDKLEGKIAVLHGKLSALDGGSCAVG
ncbi:MAG: hypothetical protein JWL90_732 [Chthoniobacteraceae bacterium]|nr:hypothetical protein [Chthoniobacteraceae bacterium]